MVELIKEHGIEYEIVTTVMGVSACVNKISAGGDVCIPKTIKGVLVSSINEKAAFGNVKITSIRMAASVQKIEEHAFAYCHMLKNVYIDNDVNNCTFIMEQEAFLNCNSLEVISSTRKIELMGHGHFSGCNHLIAIPTITGNIAPKAFFNAKKLERIQVADNTQIYAQSFLQSSVNQIVILNGTIKHVAKKAWSDLSNITILAKKITNELQDLAYNGIQVVQLDANTKNISY